MEAQLKELKAIMVHPTPIFVAPQRNEIATRKRKTIRCVSPFDEETDLQSDSFLPLIRRQHRKVEATDIEDSILEENFKRCVVIEDNHDLQLLKNCTNSDDWLEMLADVWDAFPMPPESEIMKLAPMTTMVTSITLFER